MLIWMMVVTAWSQPTASVSWKGEMGQVAFAAPAGQKINPLAPAEINVSVGDAVVSIQGPAGRVAAGVALGDVRGHEVLGQASVPVCTLDGVTCTVSSFEFSASVPDARKGEAVCAVAQRSPAEHVSPYQADANRVFDEALAAAAASDRPVLLDFGAVWCPPCNALSAEVLDAPDPAGILGDLVLAKIDVDDVSSWRVKDRYQVGSYPTLVVVNAQGEELDRMVGYPGPEDTVSWLVETVHPTDSTSAPTLDDATPSEAAEEALRRAQRNLDGVADWLLAAQGAEEEPSFRIARAHERPSVEDASWLAVHVPHRALEWVFPMMDLPEAAPAVRVAATAALPNATALEAADLLWVLGETTELDDATLFYGAAAAMQRSAMSGVPAEDRGYWGWLAQLYRLAERPAEALAIYDRALEVYPEDPTWFLGKARLLMKLDRPTEALAMSGPGLGHAWGDNRLRMGIVHVEALLALGRNDEAVSFVDQLLASEAPPEESLHVRTHRYRDTLADRVSSLRQEP